MPDNDHNSLDELLRRAEAGQADDDTTNSQPADEKGDKSDKEGKDTKKSRRHNAKLNSKEEKARALFKQLTSEEGDETEMPLTLRNILGGDMLAHKVVRRNMGYIILLCAMAIIYVANRYSCQREEIRCEELAAELADRKFKALTIAAELTEYSMSTSIRDNLPDTTLQTSTTAAYSLTIDDETIAEEDSIADETPQQDEEKAE